MALSLQPRGRRAQRDSVLTSPSTLIVRSARIRHSSSCCNRFSSSIVAARSNLYATTSGRVQIRAIEDTVPDAYGTTSPVALYPIFFQNGSATDAFVSTIENRIIVTDRRSTIPQVVSITVTDENRPGLTVDLTGTELLRWYWLKEELTDFARRLDIRATGDKELLVQRIAARLDGVPFAEPQLAKRATRAQLGGPLTSATVIPKGQRCSQVIRAWFIEQVGASFGFDAEMRAFFVHTDGTQTMQDALDRYRATREQGPKPIDAQFEYNRFTRAWHEANPAGPREDLLHAWQRYRERPVDQRGMLSLQLSPSPARRYASAESMGSTLGA